MPRPTVSVIIPTYNRASMLRQALESVRLQGVEDVEIIIVDSHSTDETLQVIQEFQPGILHLQQKRLGVAAARNLGIRNASAPFIAFLDSDDLWLADKLKRQLDFLQQHPEVALVYARMWSYSVESPQKRRLDPPTVARSFEQLLNGRNTVTTSTVIVRRECFDTVGVFNPHLRAAEDHELWLRILRQFPIAFMDEVMAEYRRHGISINTDPPLLYDGYRRYFEIILNEYRPWLKNPRAAERHLAKFEYLCGTTALKKGEARRAVGLVGRALQRDRWLGKQFIRQETSWPQKLWLPIKPYAALTVSVVRSAAAPRGGRS